MSNWVAGRFGGLAGWNSRMASGKSWYGSWGRLFGSRSSCKVACVGGANGPVVSACLAADNSPWCVSCRARLARCSIVGWSGGAAPTTSVFRGSGGLSPGSASVCTPPWRSKRIHSSCWKLAMRVRHSGLDKVRVPGGRWSNIRGNSIQSFHARTVCSWVWACMIASSAKVRAWRRRPLRKEGGV